jgi:LmbE family N-acetylglucosaminyl deacetylase
MRIVCIHAHPDDAEILAGGTLALLARLGHQITIVTMTAGDCGSAEFGPEEIAAIRKAEAAESAMSIGAEYRCAGFRDLAIFNDDASRRTVTGLIREIKAEIVLTAAPADYHCDHEATSQLVRDACFGASVPNYQTPSSASPLPAIPHLYFVDPIEMVDRAGSPISPDFVIDIESTFDMKRTMLAKHASQRDWLRKQHGLDDYLNQMEQWTRTAGARAGVALGEGFRQYRIHPFPKTPVLQDLLRAYIASL